MNVRLASVRMTPEIMHNSEGNTTTVDGGYDVSSSDDGIDVCPGGTYFPWEEGKDSIDNSYNIAFMEEDGDYDNFLSGMQFIYEELESELTPHLIYNGRGPCLRYGVDKRFQTVMECVGVCGGMDYDFFKWIMANSNEYARLKMSNEGVFAGTDWTKIKHVLDVLKMC